MAASAIVKKKKKSEKSNIVFNQDTFWFWRLSRSSPVSEPIQWAALLTAAVGQRSDFWFIDNLVNNK